MHVGPGMASAEAGSGATWVLVAGLDGSGVRPHKSRKGTEGGAGSREAGLGVSGVLFKLGSTGTRKWWAGTQGAGPVTEVGVGQGRP